MLKLKNYINGRWVAPSTGRYFNSINPAHSSQVVAQVPKSGATDVDKAVKAAKKAFEKWRLVPAPKRGELLYKVAQMLEEQKSKVGDLVIREMGKAKPESYGDVQEGVDIGYYMAGEGRRLHGQTFHSELQNKTIKSVRDPIGVFGLITPWNFPVAIPCWKLFPALVTGNTVVFKPSQYVAACAAALIKVFDEAGIPPGVLNLVLGTGSEVGDPLVRHKDVKGISFTGSSAVGSKIGKICGPLFKNHHLEMGGKNCTIIMDDAHLDLAVDGCVWAGFGTTGQRCTAGSRVIVHKNIYPAFKKKFLARVKKLKLGPSYEKGYDVGPLINEDQLKKVASYMDIAKKKDKVKLLCGGKRAEKGKLAKGYFFEPTLLDNVKPHHKVAQEEIFGPVVSLIKVNNLKEAIKVANGVRYGLSASIFTQDVNNANIAARDLQTAIVYVNTSSIGAEVHAPFGGVKDTGNGHREAGGLGGAIDSYTEVKVINVDFSGSLQKAQGIDWGK